MLFGTAVWYSTGLPADPICWVPIRDPGEAWGFETRTPSCTALTTDRERIILWVVRRFEMPGTINQTQPSPMPWRWYMRSCVQRSSRLLATRPGRQDGKSLAAPRRAASRCTLLCSVMAKVELKLNFLFHTTSPTSLAYESPLAVGQPRPSVSCSWGSVRLTSRSRPFTDRRGRESELTRRLPATGARTQRCSLASARSGAWERLLWRRVRFSSPPRVARQGSCRRPTRLLADSYMGSTTLASAVRST